MERWSELLRPGADSIVVGERTLRRGSRVVLRPRTSDPFARALAGRHAFVDAVLTDLDDRVQLAVILEDDPARALGTARQLAHRFFFSPEEIEPLAESEAPHRRVLVAGIGNVFLGDDGFGVEVVRRVAASQLPAGVDVVEFGIRGIDLAYALGDGYDAALLVDAAPRGEPPGTLSVIEPLGDDGAGLPLEGHGMDPVRVLALARRIGTLPARTLVVACEPATVVDPDSGELLAALSPVVNAAVEPAVALVASLATDLLALPSEVEQQ
jgi:hydrogenase maturation protease